MSRMIARLLGRRFDGDDSVDTAVKVDGTYYTAGKMQVAELRKRVYAAPYFISTSWMYRYGAISTAPVLLRKLEILNPTAGALTFELALMNATTGTPTSVKAFLAWDTSIDAKSVWSWEGEVPLIGKWIHAKASGSGLVMFVMAEELDP
jgi:hypothetical protein